MRRLRHLARRVLFARQPFWLRLLLQALMAFAGPVGAVWETARCLRRTAAADRPTRPWGWVRRAGHMLLLAWIDNVPPRNYLLFRLHVPARHSRIADSFYGAEIQALNSHLNRLNGAAGDDVRNKERFAELCRAWGLACIPTLAVFRDGGQSVPPAPFFPDQPDVWVKDLMGSRGSGAARWIRQAEGFRHAWDGRVCSPAEMVAQWRRRDCIIQPCLINHPSLVPLSDGSLVVFRMITGIDRAGRVAVIDALAQFPCGGSGLQQVFAGVDPVGTIRAPHLRGFWPVSRHPDTGAGLAGVRIPFWPEALALVETAHCGVPEFSRFVFLGWDVAITGQGPLLIEANDGWGAVNHQSGDGVPLGLTPLPAIALDHLAAGPRCD